MKAKIKSAVSLFLLLLVMASAGGCEYLLQYEDEYDDDNGHWDEGYDWEGELYTEITLVGTVSFPRVGEREAVRFVLNNTGDAVCNDVLAEVFFRKDNFIINQGKQYLGSMEVNERRDTYVYLEKGVQYNSDYKLEIKISWFNKAGDYFEVINTI